jgi:protein phosphatase 2C family protein 2/3
LVNGFANAEKKFIENAYDEEKRQLSDKSGSCAVVLLIVDDLCFVANVGDCRAILSSNGGKKVTPLSKDHKPSDDAEKKRIILNGGTVY